MPFVIDYAPVEALGSLAMQTGKAQGTTSGRASFLGRQSSVDQQSAEINQRNREMAYQQTWAPINAQRQAALQNQQSNAQMDRTYLLNEASQRNAATRQNFAQQEMDKRAATGDAATAQRQAQGITQRHEADFASKSQEDQRHEQAVVVAMQASGEPNDKIMKTIAQIRVQRALGTGAGTGQAPAALMGNMPPKRPTQPTRGLGFDAAAGGNLPAWTDEAIRKMTRGSHTIPQQVTQEMASGVFEYLSNESVPIEQLQKIASDPATPPWAQAPALRALSVRGDVLYGANQARPNAGSMSTPDLLLQFQ